ncbi:hypothetical protein GF361_04175 [Candidatus Woesearchaeota archaeon]|nr:hypothetical protein [Candidatus Woesearchaeota archaeon]
MKELEILNKIIDRQEKKWGPCVILDSIEPIAKKQGWNWQKLCKLCKQLQDRGELYCVKVGGSEIRATITRPEKALKHNIQFEKDCRKRIKKAIKERKVLKNIIKKKKLETS